MNPETLNCINVLAACTVAICSIVALFIASMQLSGLKSSIDQAAINQRLSALMAILEIESQLNDRKVQFDNITTAVINANGNQVLKLSIDFDVAKENYLNALDRLCFCISKNFLDEGDLRSEYRDMIRNTIENFPSDFGEGSPYNHIKDINEKWQYQ